MPGYFSISRAILADAPAIAAIYAHHVLHGTASFEIVPPEASEIAARMTILLDHGWPWLVARGEAGAGAGAGAGDVLGYAYAGQYHARSAYRFACENSIYIRHDRLGRGIGTALLAELIGASEAAGFRQMVALIAGTEPASVALHERAGFRHCGKLASVGRKHGRWIDVLHMQRVLGPGDTAPPAEEPR